MTSTDNISITELINISNLSNIHELFDTNIKNKKIKTKKKSRASKPLSYKSYIKTIHQDVSGLLKKKRKKISQDDFQILQFSQFNHLIHINYNVKQLKSICKYYRQKSSGNKKELNNTCYNFLKLSYHLQKIQKIFRGYIVRKLFTLRGPAYITRKCTNETDFFTLEDLKEIPNVQFFSYKDKDDFTYGFDICSLYNMIVVEKMEKKNPYNRNPFPKDIISNIKTIARLSKLLGYTLNIVIDNKIDELSIKKKIELKTLNIFQKIDELGFITIPQWFLNLNRTLLRTFIHELMDIWNYRAQLSNETKYKIEPIRGNPFYTFNIPFILTQEKHQLQKRILEIIEIFITSGVTREDRSLGVYYVLGALTMVCASAANSLPWLYESFAIIH
jgi:hypothetical protein